MSKIFNNQPTNINFLSPVGFRFNIEYLPNTNWFMTSVNLPGISLGEINQPTPFMQTQVPGNDLVFDPLNITFQVDEDMQNWREIYDWMNGLGFPNEYGEYKAQKAKQLYSDASLSILNSDMNINYIINFTDLFPTSLSEILFDSASGDIETIKATVNFRYLAYSYEKL
tara:strand:+ start:7561 stop:8067 length:507 start_codon:yes stop_codon:yes gene_type:complete